MGSTGASRTYQVLKDHIGLAHLLSCGGRPPEKTGAVLTPTLQSEGEVCIRKYGPPRQANFSFLLLHFLALRSCKPEEISCLTAPSF